MKQIIIILGIFFLDRTSKIYLLSLQSSGTDIDFYINSFLNFYLVWNTGIGFGLVSMETNIFYHILTAIIFFIILVLIYMTIKSEGLKKYSYIMVLGGALGNLFDRVSHKAVPDFIDFHVGNFHWFIFNVADIFITIGVLFMIIFELTDKKQKL